MRRSASTSLVLACRVSRASLACRLAGLTSQGVGVTPAHVSGRYHQSLRIQIYLSRNSRSHRRRQTDGAFSTDSGLDRLGVVGSVYWAESLYNLQPALKGWSGEGAPAGSPMPKSISFLLKG